MTPEEFEAHWAMASPWLERALTYGGAMWGLADVKARVEGGTAHYHADPSAVAITEFVITPKVKALNFWLIGGNRAGLDRLRPRIESWGLSHGCTRFMGAGRRGHERRFGQDGYRPVATLFVKDVLTGTTH